MRVDHLAIAVRNPRTSLLFYCEIVGIDGPARVEEHGFVITTGDVSFTLLEGQPPSSFGDFHIGASLPDAETVRPCRTELSARGVDELEWSDEPGYVSIRIADPDGYPVELSWEQK